MTTEPQAQVKISCRDLDSEMNFFVKLGFKLYQVFPADNPRKLTLQGFGLVLQLEKGLPVNDLTLVLPNQSDQQPTFSPSGVNIQFQQKSSVEVNLPEQIPFILTTFDESSSWIKGRAGMQYRDLLPKRLDGAMIASNIRIPEGGPVPDHVHFHHIQFQLIFCTKGWVKVVYEDQGEPFILAAGDCVTQPPGIRHQVLEASAGLEVVEIGLPAEHMTTLDYQTKLPSDQQLPQRTYVMPQTSEQRFSHHQHKIAEWHPWYQGQLQRCKTSIKADSNGYASVNVIRAANPNRAQTTWQHSHQLRFYYLINGQVKLKQEQSDDITLKARDCFLLPGNRVIDLSDFSTDFQCFELTVL